MDVQPVEDLPGGGSRAAEADPTARRSPSVSLPTPARPGPPGYDRRDLVRTYLAAQGKGFGGYYPDSASFNRDLKASYKSLLTGLERLFGLRLTNEGMPSTDAKIMFMLFHSTASSFLAIRTPWSGVLEGGLLVRKIEEAGPSGQQVMHLSEQISALAEQSRRAHLDLLDSLVAILLGDRAELTFTIDDLQAIGVQDVRPDPADYPLYED